MDITDMLTGKSEQLDNIELLSGPRDFTITGVRRGTDDQPLNIDLAEHDRPWKPNLTMRRLLAAIWGADASIYIGRRVRLYRDPDVRYGSEQTGGVRLSHASHLDKPQTVSLKKAQGRYAAWTVQPLPDSPTPAVVSGPSEADVAAATDKTVLAAWWKASSPEMRALIEARVAELGAAQ